MASRLNQRHHLKYKICVSGAAETGHCAIDALEKAEQIGRVIAEAGMVLVTGATTGIPYWSAKGAKEAGGMVIGLSPAASEAAHIRSYKLPTDYHDVIVYTGFDYAGRNLLLTRSADAIINICGRLGTLNEFTRKVTKKSVKKVARPAKKKVKVVKAKFQKPIGVVTHFYGGIEVAIMKFKKPVKAGLVVRIKGATTDFEQKIKSMQYDHKDIAVAKKGQEVGVKVDDKVRQGDEIFDL
ncbi:MAG: hypothetical protein G01um101419_854 [Parcubacteria group bacterium Gr01-1014_19]|nr:MAG: hypothetical protein G01um101419_854 [Parcubacteria group bacterium Gr01-1014_19]